MELNNRHSQHARRALYQARLLAQEYQHDVIDTDHLLVGILRERGSLGCQVLADLNVDTRRAELEVRMLHPAVDPLITTLDLTPALRRVLVLSVEESRWFGHHYIGTEHFVLALARSRAGGVSDLLRTLAISPDQIRRRMRLLLNDDVSELSIEAAKRFARLSELSRRVLNAAGQLAAGPPDGTGRAVVGLDHLLLVLAREQRSPVSRLLSDCGLDVAALEAALGQFMPGDALNAGAVLEDVIDQAGDRADQLGTHYTGTDHLLLALAQNPYGARLMQQVGVDRARLIAAVYRDLLPPGEQVP